VERRGVLLALLGIGIVVAFVIGAFKFSNNDTNPIPNLGTTTSSSAAPTPSSPKPKPKPKKRVAVPNAPFRFFVVAVGGSCWMDVRNYSSSGRTLFTGTVDPGQSHRFVARRLWMSLGNPGRLKASLNGRVVAFPGNGRPVTVRVTRQGITVAPPTA
jgi:hypothetical protein